MNRRVYKFGMIVHCIIYIIIILYNLVHPCVRFCAYTEMLSKLSGKKKNRASLYKLEKFKGSQRSKYLYIWTRVILVPDIVNKWAVCYVR